LCVFILFVLFCVVSGPLKGQFAVLDVLPAVYRIKKRKNAAKAQNISYRDNNNNNNNNNNVTKQIVIIMQFC
jgi:hypothetical protein